MFCNTFYSSVIITALLFSLPTSASCRTNPHNLAANGNMTAVTTSGLISGWQPFEKGYTRDAHIAHTGPASVRCSSTTRASTFGAVQTIVLNQSDAAPITISGWSRAQNAHGVGGANYCLYVDVTYTDGSHLWGQSVNFDSGTHGWQRRTETILPAKPIQSLNLYLLFRSFEGTAWFGDVHVFQVSGSRVWDGQAIQPPSVSTHRGARALRFVGTKIRLGFTSHGALTTTLLNSRLIGTTAGGFFMRDVKTNSGLVRLSCSVSTTSTNGRHALALSAMQPTNGLRLHALVEPVGSTLIVSGTVRNVLPVARAVTVYFAVPVNAVGWRWGSDIRTSQIIKGSIEYHNWAPVGVGACGSISRYPFGEVNNTTGGVMMALSRRMPATSRLFYNAPARQLVVAFDYSLAAVGSRTYRDAATFRFRIDTLPPAPASWGFREAAAQYYAMHPRSYPSTTVAGGIWIPFTDPETVARPEDFHFRYHEGDNSTVTDRALGILSFHYSEPSSFWLPMPKNMPRTYHAVMALIRSQLNAGTSDQKMWAQALLNSGTRRKDGRLNVQFRNEPWCDGALFILNPNPALAAVQGEITKATLTYNRRIAVNRYVIHASTAPSGEYLDSLEAWLNTESDVPNQLAACPYPATFDTASLTATVPQWYSLFGLVNYMSRDLRARGKQLMANTTPVNFWCFMPMLDEAGIEVNWLDGNGAYSPDDDAIFDYRRTLSYHKPYLLLMNTNFDKFNHVDMARYFRRCLFYDVFPSCFSADAADHPYWETPRWYNRDRQLFKTYVPIMQMLSRAGWQPIPYAESSNTAVYLERYGTTWITLRNHTDSPQQSKITLWAHELNIINEVKLEDSLSGWSSTSTRPHGDRCSFSVSLTPHQVMAIRIDAR